MGELEGGDRFESIDERPQLGQRMVDDDLLSLDDVLLLGDERSVLVERRGPLECTSLSMRRLADSTPGAGTLDVGINEQHARRDLEEGGDWVE
jgi:hypothetical protein